LSSFSVIPALPPDSLSIPPTALFQEYGQLLPKKGENSVRQLQHSDGGRVRRTLCFDEFAPTSEGPGGLSRSIMMANLFLELLECEEERLSVKQVRLQHTQ
jgi:hypothetical protein